MIITFKKIKFFFLFDSIQFKHQRIILCYKLNINHDVFFWSSNILYPKTKSCNKAAIFLELFFWQKEVLIIRIVV